MDSAIPWRGADGGFRFVRSGMFAASPVIRQISQRGMVFRSCQLLPVGTQLALGLHLVRSCGGGANPASGVGTTPASTWDAVRPSGSFLTLNGLVVECRMVTSAPDVHDYEVTVLFEGVGQAEAAVLREAALVCRHRDSRASGGTPLRRSNDSLAIAFGPN